MRTPRKPRTVVVEKRTAKDGTVRYDARWYCPDWTDCEPALKAGRKFCRGHKKGTCGFATQAEAMEAGYAAQATAASGRPHSSLDTDTTLDDLAEGWFASGPDGISPRTMRGYEERWFAWKRRNGAIGLVPVTAVDKARVMGWLQELRRHRLSASTMRQDLILLRHILGYATDLGLTPSNPARGVKVPASLQPKPGKRPRLSEGDIWKVAEAIESQYEVTVLLGAYTGLRLGELLGLRAKQIDRTVEPYVINVTTQWDEREKRFRRPKRDKTRKVPVAPAIAHLLDKHLLTYPASHTEQGTVFATRNGTVVSQSNFRKTWNRTLAELGLPKCAPHSLRATFVDIWVDKGVPINDVRDMAGHEDIAITMNTYKGDANIDKLSNSIMTAVMRDASESGDLGKVINGASGILAVSGVHSDGRIDHLTALPSIGSESESDTAVLRFSQT